MSAELNAEGTDYLLLSGSPPPDPPLFATLQVLLQASPVPLTRRELLARWPDPPPRPDSLWRTLARGLERGRFVVHGAEALKGVPGDPAHLCGVVDGRQMVALIRRRVWMLLAPFLPAMKSSRPASVDRFMPRRWAAPFGLPSTQ